MPSSLFSAVQGLLEPRIVADIASRLGDPEAAVSRGFESSIASVIGGLANKVGDGSVMRQIFDLVSGAPSDLNVSNLAGAITATGSGSPLLDAGNKFLSLIFGGSQSAVADAAAKASGLRSSSMSTIMSLAAPLLMTVLGRRVREGNMTPTSLGSMLTSEAAGIQRLIPEGVLNLLRPVSAAASPVRSVGQASLPERARPAWLWPVVGAAVLVGALLLWLIGRNRESPIVTAQVPEAASGTADRMRSGAAKLGEMISVKLPGGIDLRVPQYGVEGRLAAFIQDPSMTVDRDTWFDFDRLLFDTGSATLRPESQEQLQNVAAIMKAYPNVRLKIGGYTDNTGDPAQNKKLSEDRANSVMNELTRLGISPSRLEAEGYGDQHPVADNSTEEGRAKNRRISMRVMQK